MSTHDLASDEGLRAAVEAIGDPSGWSEAEKRWTRDIAETIRWVRSADVLERSTREFQERLWNDNHIAAVGQGNINIGNALDDPGFRSWFAERSMNQIPGSKEEWSWFLTELHLELEARLQPFLGKGVPHLKIFRVLAALYPEAMTTIASRSALASLFRVMGGETAVEPAGRHVWIRHRLDGLLGDPGSEPQALAERMVLAWMLHEQQFAGAPTSVPSNVEASTGDEVRLNPLRPEMRRRGLTAVRGYFPVLLSTLRFVGDGVPREDLLEFLRSSAPDSKDSSLRVGINALQSEFDVLRREGDQYVPTERGRNVLATQDAGGLADWLLTRILGVDHLIAALRDRGPLPVGELTALVQTVNPGWTTAFAPQAMLGWLRSMGVVRTTETGMQDLTDAGKRWAELIHWQPESLPPDPPPIIDPRPPIVQIVLPALSDIIASVQTDVHFSASLITRLHAGLWAHARRHFAILTGLSGSGKTMLALKYARALINGGSDKQLRTFPVQPGWYDPGALLGYANPLRGDSYVRTKFLELLIAAAGDPQHPYVAVLDEMNLSHPEQYMAPLLSAMETGGFIELHTEGEMFDGVPEEIRYPNNLVLIGTVNMDETTHGLSDKVLDRAFVHEFWEVDLNAYPHWGDRRLDAVQVGRAREILTLLMNGLSPTRLHFGWRVVDDVLDYLGQAAQSGGALSFEDALDDVIYAKVLPKLRGEDTVRLRTALKFCEETLKAAGLNRSHAKVAELRMDLETTGSARFWR